MMPTIHTQITIPTQVSFVATPLPGTAALRALPDAVSPSVSNAALGPDYKGNGGYASENAPAPSATTPAPASVLNMLIPASFSTASASLSASAMFATQLLAQDASGGEILASYEELVAAAQVKYKPSDATLPPPAPNNLFAKMLAETQTQQRAQLHIQTQQHPKETATQAAVQAPLSSAKNIPSPVKPKSSESPSTAAVAHQASHVYRATGLRNQQELEAPETVDRA